MPTILSFLSGRQITNDSGVPQAGAKLYHYRENTTTLLTVWQNDIATVTHTNPVVCDAGGFVPLIYVDDTFDWKVVVKTSSDVTLKPYDELPKAASATAAATYSFAKFPWAQVSAASSPIALTAADAGKAYEADTTGGNVEFDLPAAGSVANGTGFIFKKTAAANSMIIDPNGAETIDDVSTSLTITAKDEIVGILSNVAEWYIVDQYAPIIAASDAAAGVIELAIQSEMETATSALLAVTPGRQHFHPGHPKFWAMATVAAGVPTLVASHNVTSITDTGPGLLTVTIATDFSSANWCGLVGVEYQTGEPTGQIGLIDTAGRAAGSVVARCMQTGASSNATLDDPDAWHIVGFGDQV